MDEQLTALMAQLSAGLRRIVIPPDRWQVELVNWVDWAPEREPWYMVQVTCSRDVDGRTLRYVQHVSPQMLAQATIGAEKTGEWLGRHWQEKAAAAIAVATVK